MELARCNQAYCIIIDSKLCSRPTVRKNVEDKVTFGEMMKSLALRTAWPMAAGPDDNGVNPYIPSIDHFHPYDTLRPQKLDHENRS